jgi:ribosomal protein S18 acetylase RimI-like enzyme
MPPEPALRIRHALTPADTPRLARLWDRLGWGTEDEPGRARLVRALSGSAWLAIAELDGGFAGYARALSDGAVLAYLAEVAVLPELRRRGIGSALVRSCLEAFPHLTVYADAVPAMIGLNTRHGLLPRTPGLTTCARGPLPDPLPASEPALPA